MFSVQRFFLGLTLVCGALQASAQTVGSSTPTVPVTVDNFVRAESDMEFAAVVKLNGLGRFGHLRELAPLNRQIVVRVNRDTLYSTAVFDLDAGPVTIDLPDAGKRFRSMIVINEDHYAQQVVYDGGKYTLTKDKIGTRYVLLAVRTLVDPADPADLKQAHALQDGIKVEQRGAGQLEVPNWDPVSLKKVRDALRVLGSTVPDARDAFGRKGEVSPIRHLIGTAVLWGGNPDKDAIYLTVTPPKNDGKTSYRLHVRDVPVDGFWSVTVYNASGYIDPNPLNAYTINSVVAKKAADGAVDVQFGGCDGKRDNCLPIEPGWNYTVRLYRPRPEVLNGKWDFPKSVPMS
ncbi:conserved exported hypothetical protein [Paraburkholderia piptadeniae]|uniref:Carboxylesterase n=1 Tax=Paraburkholderia piptadeniae TaxID=1701573 RepID=A0A1N7RLH3_9BURK|nr:DUF1254 domain-containing protein [Paraburkholderia piptadeniae]SIT35968.1 conserved exported hypothetical protein [Paraburkholderia piptadeniae]